MKKILPLFALLSVTTCYAGDASTTEFLGFSPDGSVVGFQEFGVQDGSGFTYCKVMLVNTEKNTYLVPPAEVVVESERESSTDVICHQAKSKLRTNLASLKLNPKLGVRIGADTARIVETETGNVDEFGEKTQLLKVILKTSQGEKVIQDDQVLPRSRKSVTRYELEDGYRFETENKVVHAFTIRYFTPGFEGQDVRTMVVTNSSVK